jgi:hypothetical protein
VLNKSFLKLKTMNENSIESVQPNRRSSVR